MTTEFHHGGHFDAFWFSFVRTYFQSFFNYNFGQEHLISDKGPFGTKMFLSDPKNPTTFFGHTIRSNKIYGHLCLFQSVKKYCMPLFKYKYKSLFFLKIAEGFKGLSI